MKKTTLISILYFFSIPLFCQNLTLKGTVINAQNNEPISFAAVGLVQANKGISTDEHGVFQLEDVDTKDSLLVSCVGYKRFMAAVKDVKTDIKLTPSVIELPTVTIKPLKKKELVLNDFSKKDKGYYRSTKLSEMSQLAQVFENPDGGTWFVKSIKLAQLQWLFLIPKQPSVFKIRFYSVDEKGKPSGIDLCPAELVKSDGSHIETIYFSEEGLQIPKNGLAIAIEWIKTGNNKYLRKYSEKDKNGKKYKREEWHYAPEIGMIKSSDTRTVFKLNYRNEWVYDEPLFEKGFKYEKLKLALTLSN